MIIVRGSKLEKIWDIALTTKVVDSFDACIIARRGPETRHAIITMDEEGVVSGYHDLGYDDGINVREIVKAAVLSGASDIIIITLDELEKDAYLEVYDLRVYLSYLGVNLVDFIIFDRTYGHEQYFSMRDAEMLEGGRGYRSDELPIKKKPEEKPEKKKRKYIAKK